MCINNGYYVIKKKYSSNFIYFPVSKRVGIYWCNQIHYISSQILVYYNLYFRNRFNVFRIQSIPIRLYASLAKKLIIFTVFFMPCDYDAVSESIFSE